MIYKNTWIKRSTDFLENNRRFLLRLSAIAIILSSSAYLGYRITRVSRTFLLFIHPLPIMIFGLPIVAVFLQWPQIGIIGLVTASIIKTISFGTGSQTPLDASVILLIMLIGLWLFDMVIRKRSILLIKSRVIAPLIVFSVVVLLSFGFGQLPWFAFSGGTPLRAQFGGIAIFILSFGALLLVGHQIKELHWLEWLTWIFLILSGIVVVGQLVPEIGRINSRLINSGINNGSLFWTWLAAIAFSQALLNRNLKLPWRIAIATLFLAQFTYYLTINHDWLSGWIPPLTAILTIVWLSMPRLRVPIVIIVVAAVFFFSSNILGFIMTGDNTYSLSTRFAAWKIVLDIAKVNPIFGLGPANYYRITSIYPIMGYYVMFNSHNNYVDVFAQTGLLGITCFVWFAVEMGKLGLKLRDQFKNSFANAYVYGVLGGLVGSLVAGVFGDWVLPFVYNVGFQGFHASVLGWMFMGGLLALEGMYIVANKSNSNETSL